MVKTLGKRGEADLVVRQHPEPAVQLLQFCLHTLPLTGQLLMKRASRRSLHKTSTFAFLTLLISTREHLGLLGFPRRLLRYFMTCTGAPVSYSSRHVGPIPVCEADRTMLAMACCRL